MQIISAYSELDSSKLKSGREHFYNLAAGHLEETAKIFGNEIFIEKLEGYDDWILNTHLKPWFIKQTLIRVKEPVLWIDVDSEICRHIEDLHFPADLVVAYRSSPYIKHHHKKKLYAPIAVLWFNYTAESLIFLATWEARCATYKNEAAHDNFARTWEALVHTGHVTVDYLPDSWSKDPFDTRISNPVIEYRGSGHL